MVLLTRAVSVDNSMGCEDVDLLMRKQTLVSGQPIEHGCRVHIAPRPVSLDLTDVLHADVTSASPRHGPNQGRVLAKKEKNLVPVHNPKL